MERNREKIDKNGNIINYINVLNGYLDGKQIECRRKVDGASWCDSPKPAFDFNHFEYRIKPIQTYRPYINGDEAYTAMQENTPFGWLYNKETLCYEYVVCIGANGIKTHDGNYSYEEAFDTFTYPNNLRFGVKLYEEV